MLKGDIESAIRYTREVFPDLFEPSNSKASRVLFFCKCQQFIECIRSGETQKSLEFMQTNLSHYFRVSNAIDKDFLEVTLLLFYYFFFFSHQELTLFIFYFRVLWLYLHIQIQKHRQLLIY